MTTQCAYSLKKTSDQRDSDKHGYQAPWQDGRSFPRRTRLPHVLDVCTMHRCSFGKHNGIIDDSEISKHLINRTYTRPSAAGINSVTPDTSRSRRLPLPFGFAAAAGSSGASLEVIVG